MHANTLICITLQKQYLKSTASILHLKVQLQLTDGGKTILNIYTIKLLLLNYYYLNFLTLVRYQIFFTLLSQQKIRRRAYTCAMTTI